MDYHNTPSNNSINEFMDNIVDEVIQEPIGGAHRSKEQVLESTKLLLLKCKQNNFVKLPI